MRRKNIVLSKSVQRIIQNITKVTEPDSFIWLESTLLSEFDYTELFNPYHSIKFYTHPFGEDSTIGWKIRNYEFSLYVIVDLIQDGPNVDFYFLDDEKVIPSETEKEISILLNDHHEENPRFPGIIQGTNHPPGSPEGNLMRYHRCLIVDSFRIVYPIQLSTQRRSVANGRPAPIICDLAF